MLKLFFYLIPFIPFAFIPFGYIDPGSGFPFFSVVPLIIGIAIGFLGGIIFMIKKFFYFLRKFLLITLLLLGIMGFIIWKMSMSEYPEFPQKILIIAMDGLDYNLMKEFLSEDELPNFRKLKERGSFLPLETICPPQSNVVWASFSTGMNPGNHGIFDFIMRDPKNYLPYLSLTEISSQPQRLKIGPFEFPLLRPKINNRRKASGFWEITSQRKIPTYVYFCPGTFPPEKIYGKMISGMGVPDIRGTMGTFSFYTTRPLEKDKDIGGLVFNVSRKSNLIATYLYGPRDTSKTPAQDIKIPLNIEINPESRKVKIEVQNNIISLKEKEWSNWVRVRFKIDAFRKIEGICRFYLKSIEPDFELYCSPINFAPQTPIFPISYPKNFSKKLAKEIGLFYTQGMPYDTWALNERRIDEDVFLQQANFVLEEREKIFKKEFLKFRGGIFFFYFGYPDPIQHMFWHYRDKRDSGYHRVVLACYKKMDEILGWVMDRIDKDTLLIVLSDHGFGSFRRAVHLNSWLRDNGLLYLKDNEKESKEFFERVDWLRTEAYALGLGGIYINQIGREAKGIIYPGKEKEEVKKEIIDKLSQWRDPKTGDPVVRKVYTQEEVFKGKFNQDAPDLFVGFNLGYRASWQTALGAVPSESIEDNLKAWQADHIFDPQLVEGVLFTNMKINSARKPKIIDIVPTVLKFLGIDYEDLDGKSLL